MGDANSFSDKMQKLQQMRVAMVLLLSAENSKVMSQRQRASGKEIEVMCAERDAADGPAASAELDRLYAEDRAAKDAVAETDAEIARMEEILAKIDADISATCQS